MLQVAASQPQPPAVWDQLEAHLRATPGVEAVAQSDRALMAGNAWNGFIAAEGRRNDTLSYFQAISRGWLEAMKITLVDGRDFREADAYPGAVIVNEAFAKAYFDGANPVGKAFQLGSEPERYEVVGLVRDARYRGVREQMLPAVFFPLESVRGKGMRGLKSRVNVVVRTVAANPLALAQTLRREVSRAHAAFRVSTLRTQQEINDAHTLRERLLAVLALFFAVVALLLAAVGLYGVLDYSVVQRRREIGIRMALGAEAMEVARGVTLDSFAMVLAGTAAGLGLGIYAARWIETLLHGVRATDGAMLAVPLVTLLAAALIAIAPGAIRAARVDPAWILRAD